MLIATLNSAIAQEAVPRLFVSGSDVGITYQKAATVYGEGLFQTHIVLTSKGANSGAITIKTGVSYQSADHYTTLPVYIDKTTGSPVIQAYLDPDSDLIHLRKVVGGGTDALLASDISGSFEIVVGGPFFVGDTVLTFADADPTYPWYEFAQTAEGSILVSYNVSGGVRIRKNTQGGQGGPEAWLIVTTLPYAAYETTVAQRIYAPMSKLSNGNLAIVVGNGEMTNPTELGWIEISDDGETYSALNAISIPLGSYWYGPLIEMGNGDLVLSSHSIYTNNSDSWLNVSTDGGVNWSATTLPIPSDGNLGATEATFADLPNGDVIAIIRTDDRGTGGADGGYVSVGSSLTTLPAPSSIGEIIRMPRVTELNGQLTMAYRAYDGLGPVPSLRDISVSGALGSAFAVYKGSNNAPFVYEYDGKRFALFQQYPDVVSFRLTRLK